MLWKKRLNDCINLDLLNLVEFIIESKLATVADIRLSASTYNAELKDYLIGKGYNGFKRSSRDWDGREFYHGITPWEDNLYLYKYLPSHSY